jgi:RNA polymerase sigma factor (sigma-70 family)
MQKEMPDYNRNEDHALFILLKKSDKEAFSAIYAKYHCYLYALAFKYLKDSGMAEDVLQHVFVKLWESTADIHIEINLKNYLYTMTKNFILNLIRDHKIYIFDQPDPAVNTVRQNPPEEMRLTRTVTDNHGEPVIGANIVVPGTTIWTVTYMDGSYSMVVPRKLDSEHSLYSKQNLGYSQPVIHILQKDNRLLTRE